jgi:hypothetical protein
MHALDILRHMHAETKTQLRVILATADPGEASRAWRELEPILDLHEQLEDDFVYTPIAQESGPGTPLGDWDDRHEADVAVVKQLIAELDALDPAMPAWRMQIGRIADVLARHVTDEEGQIFGRVEQFWGADRLVEVGKKMNKARK